MSEFIKIFTSTREMPKLFGFLHLLNSITFIPILLLGFWPWPNANYVLNGKDLTYVEFWASGLAPTLLAFVFLMSYLCFATSIRKKWTRYVVFLYWSLIIFFVAHGTLSTNLIASLIIIGFAAYILRSSKLKEYYDGQSA